MDKSWLIDRQVVSVVKSMRGHIRSEFGEAVALTDDGLFAQLKAYADASRSRQLQQLQQQLEALVQPPEPDPAPATPHKVYRGQVVETAETASTDKVADKPRNSDSVRIYRGQRVSG